MTDKNPSAPPTKLLETTASLRRAVGATMDIGRARPYIVSLTVLAIYICIGWIVFKKNPFEMETDTTSLWMLISVGVATISLIAYLIFPINPGDTMLAMSKQRMIFVGKTAGVIIGAIACIAVLIYYGIRGTDGQKIGIRLAAYAVIAMAGIGMLVAVGGLIAGNVSTYLRGSLTWVYIKLWFSRTWYDIKNFIFIQQYGTTAWMKWLIVAELVIVAGYFTLPWLKNILLVRGGTVLLGEKPIQLGVPHTMMTYDPTTNKITNLYNVPDRTSIGISFLHGIANVVNDAKGDGGDGGDGEGEGEGEGEGGGGGDEITEMAIYSYNYGVSAWFFIESGSTLQETLLMDYGKRPSIYFNSRANKLVVKTKKRGDGMEELFSDEAFPLQKWNHLVVNYVGGTLDVFVNGKLVVSRKGALDYDEDEMKLVVGSDSGVAGGVKNVLYYHTPISRQDIDRLGGESAW